MLHILQWDIKDDKEVVYMEVGGYGYSEVASIQLNCAICMCDESKWGGRCLLLSI